MNELNRSQDKETLKCDPVFGTVKSCCLLLVFMPILNGKLAFFNNNQMKANGFGSIQTLCFSVNTSNVGVVRLRQPGGSIPECGPGRGINYNNGIFHHYSLPRHFTPTFHTFHTLLPLVNSILTLPLPCFPWNDKVADSVKCMKYFLVSIQIFFLL